MLRKLEQALPSYTKAADAYGRLEKEGFLSGLSAAEKQREAIEKARDLDAQRAMMSSFDANIAAQHIKISQVGSSFRSDLEKELAEVRARIAQLRPSLDKSLYREGLMELRAPQDGVIKDLATTTVGAVVQPGTVVMTLVPQGEPLFADVNIHNEDAGFVHVGQAVQIKLAAYPFQKHGMLSGQVTHISADADAAGTSADGRHDGSVGEAIYRARIRLDSQSLRDPHGATLAIVPGMQVVAELNQGKRTVLEYLLAPVQ